MSGAKGSKKLDFYNNKCYFVIRGYWSLYLKTKNTVMEQATQELPTKKQKSNTVFAQEDLRNNWNNNKKKETPVISEKTKREVRERFDLFVKEGARQ